MRLIAKKFTTNCAMLLKQNHGFKKKRHSFPNNPGINQISLAIFLFGFHTSSRLRLFWDRRTTDIGKYIPGTVSIAIEKLYDPGTARPACIKFSVLTISLAVVFRPMDSNAC